MNKMRYNMMYLVLKNENVNFISFLKFLLGNAIKILQIS